MGAFLGVGRSFLKVKFSSAEEWQQDKFNGLIENSCIGMCFTCFVFMHAKKFVKARRQCLQACVSVLVCAPRV